MARTPAKRKAGAARRGARPRKGRHWLIGLVGLIAVLCVAWYFGSPRWTLYRMREAARNGDAETLSAYVDFHALRHSLKAQMQARLDTEAHKNEDIGALGAILGGAVLGPLVDRIVSPEGVQALIAGTADRHSPAKRAAIRNPDAMIERDGLSGFTLHDVRAAGHDGDMVFRREGIGWKLVAIEIR